MTTSRRRGAVVLFLGRPPFPVRPPFRGDGVPARPGDAVDGGVDAVVVAEEATSAQEPAVRLGEDTPPAAGRVGLAAPQACPRVGNVAILDGAQATAGGTPPVDVAAPVVPLGVLAVGAAGLRPPDGVGSRPVALPGRRHRPVGLDRPAVAAPLRQVVAHALVVGPFAPHVPAQVVPWVPAPSGTTNTAMTPVAVPGGATADRPLLDAARGVAGVRAVATVAARAPHGVAPVPFPLVPRHAQV